MDTSRVGSSFQNPYIMSSKILGHIDTLYAVLAEKPTRPFCMEIHLTNQCNQFCAGCSSDYYRNKKPVEHLHSNKTKCMLQNFKDNDGKAVLWSGGGEPSIYVCQETGDHFLDLARFVDQLSLQQGIYTNGSQLNEVTMDFLVDHFQFVRVSLDAFSATVYRSIRKSNDYEQVVSNIRYLCDRKKKRNSKVTIGVSYVIRDNNLQDIEQLESWLERVKVDYVYFKPAVYQDGKHPTKEQMEEVYRQIQTIYDKSHGVALLLPYDKLAYEQSVETCYYHYFCPCLGADGKLYTCCHHVGDPKFVIGDLSEDALWNRIPFHHIDQNRHCPPNCRGIQINNMIAKIRSMQSYTHVNFM